LIAVAQVANRPIVVQVEIHLGYGATGGIVVRPTLIGQEAARLALRVLGGESPSDIPVTAGNFVRPVFDWRQLQRWKITDDKLPPGSEVRFREPSMWEQYRWQVAAIGAALLVQFLLIIFLYVEHRRRRKAEGLRAVPCLSWHTSIALRQPVNCRDQSLTRSNSRWLPW
jgi:hypothetical protein